MTDRPKRYVATHPLMKSFQFVIPDKDLISDDQDQEKILGFNFPEEYRISRNVPLTHDFLLALNVGLNLICEIHLGAIIKRVKCYKNTPTSITSDDKDFGTPAFSHVWNIKKSIDSKKLFYDRGERDVTWYLDEDQPQIVKELPRLSGLV